MIVAIKRNIKALQHWMDGRSYSTYDWASLRAAIGNHENELALKLLEHKEQVKKHSAKTWCQTTIFSCLRKAVECENLELVSALIIQPEIEPNLDRALGYAAQNGKLKSVELLVAKGADIHAGCDGALILAAENGHTEVARFLIEKGCNVQTLFDAPLKLAANNGHLETVKMLVESGADYHRGNNVAYRWALRAGHPDVARYFVFELGMTLLPGTRTWLYKKKFRDEFYEILKRDKIKAMKEHFEERLPPKGTEKVKTVKI